MGEQNWLEQHREVSGRIWGGTKSQKRSLTQRDDEVISKHALTTAFMLDTELLFAVWSCNPAGQ